MKKNNNCWGTWNWYILNWSSSVEKSAVVLNQCTICFHWNKLTVKQRNAQHLLGLTQPVTLIPRKLTEMYNNIQCTLNAIQSAFSRKDSLKLICRCNFFAPPTHNHSSFSAKHRKNFNQCSIFVRNIISYHASSETINSWNNKFFISFKVSVHFLSVDLIF